MSQLLKSSIAFCTLILSFTYAMAQHIPSVTWDRRSLIIDGHRVCPVMGEIHYSRIPVEEWAGEIRKMKEGGQMEK